MPLFVPPSFHIDSYDFDLFGTEADSFKDLFLFQANT